MKGPYPYEDYLATIRTTESRKILHTADTESIVLLENRHNTLPLRTDIGSIALIGPQADRVSVRKHITSSFPFNSHRHSVWRLCLL